VEGLLEFLAFQGMGWLRVVEQIGHGHAGVVGARLPVLTGALGEDQIGLVTQLLRGLQNEALGFAGHFTSVAQGAGSGRLPHASGGGHITQTGPLAGGREGVAGWAIHL
jgi:hypothetical protein